MVHAGFIAVETAGIAVAAHYFEKGRQSSNSALIIGAFGLLASILAFGVARRLDAAAVVAPAIAPLPLFGW